VDNLDKDTTRPKDIIYIEADDAIDDIIELIKNTENDDILIIPPKSPELLQSRVNMKFLVRTMQEAKKNLILVTGNIGIARLAKSVGLTVAKTKAGAERLLSGEEIPESDVAPEDKESDVIDGEKLNDVLEQAGVSAKKEDVKKGLEKIGKKTEEVIEKGEELGEFGTEEVGKDKKDKKDKKVPNISKLRKKIIIGSVALVALVVLGIWMFVFAPAATIIVTARTTRNQFSQMVNFVTDPANANLSNGALSITQKEITKTEEVKFEATGEREVGEKATGTMTLTRRINNSASPLDNGQPLTVSAGTIFADSTSGLKFVSVSDVILAGCTNMTNCGAPTQTVNVVAEGPGENYNLSARAFTVGGGNNATAQSTAMTGGTSRKIKIVTVEDIRRATEKLQLPDDISTNAELKRQFNDDFIIIEQSLDITRRDPVSSTPVDHEATGEVTLKQETVYSLVAVKKDDVGEFLDEALDAVVENQEDQMVFSNGVDDVSFDSFARGDAGGPMTARLRTNFRVGPVIDEDMILERSRGQILGEVQRRIGSINGVSNVDVRFSYFWVSKVPNNDDRITVDFEVEQ